MKNKLFTIYFFIFQYPILADTISDSEDLSKALNQHSYEPNYWGMILGLLLVIVLIYLTAYAYQKLIKIKIVKEEKTNDRIEILSTVSIGQNKHIHIIKANNSTFLIGATQNSITCLKEFEKIGENNFNE